jgi:GR25 family glycosyltransferase involved in LPS biosynthesis
MLTYCINLPERPDKWKLAQAEIESFGLHPLRVNGIKKDMGFDGCRLAHLNVLRNVKAPFFLTEDDVLFKGTLADLERCIEQLPPDWDLLYLGATLNEPLERYSDNLFRIKGAYTTHAIIYNSQRVVDYILKHNGGGRKIDVFYANDVQHRFNCYLCDPLIATQRAGISDIVNGYVSYEVIEDSHKKYAL